MNKVISLNKWKKAKGVEENEGKKEELESWLNGADVISSLDNLWNELYRKGYVSTKDEFYSLTVPEALKLRTKASKDATIIILECKED
jgi:hypothetical protein